MMRGLEQWKRLVLVAAVGVGAACSTKVEPATLVLRNGKIVTEDPRHKDAQAIAIQGDTVVAVGTNQDIAAYQNDATQVIDLGGKLAIPGFIEGHGHFAGVGDARMQLNLMNVKNFDEIVAMVGAAVKESQPGQLIRGRGWHQAKWDKVPTPNVEGVPLHQALDAVSPNNPVVLDHASGHAAFANAKAMELAGITKTTPNPSGGEIVKDAKGNPTGFFKETAQGLLAKARESANDGGEAADRKRMTMAAQEAVSKGITTFQDAGSTFATIDTMKKMVDEGAMPLRLWIMVREDNDKLVQGLAKYKMVGYGDKRLTVRGIKKVMDGALGSHGAWLLEPYTDLPQSTGLNTTPVEEIAETAKIAMENGFQLCVHAIGDRANRETLEHFRGRVQGQPGQEGSAVAHRARPAPEPGGHSAIRSDGRHRVDAGHSLHVRRAVRAPPAGAERAETGAYVWQSLLKSQAIVTNGTDAPVEDVNPIASFYATVSRRLKDGSIFFGEQRMTREQALKSYTQSNAYAGFEEDIKGTLKAGKLADITVLSKDIMTVPEEEIPSAEVLYTIVGGKIVYDRAKAQTD